MKTARAMVCLAAALGAGGCATNTELGGLRAKVQRPVVTAPARVTVTAEVIGGTDSPFNFPGGHLPVHGGGFVPANQATLRSVLNDRLSARGITVMAGPRYEEPLPRVRISLWALGSRSTSTLATRLLSFPWKVVNVGTVGLVPYRDERRYSYELRVVNLDAPPASRLKISRRSYTVVHFGMWEPRMGVLNDQRELAVHLEGLARVIDDALDEVLPLAEP